jgi:hypothetical protein
MKTIEEIITGARNGLQLVTRRELLAVARSINLTRACQDATTRRGAHAAAIVLRTRTVKRAVRECAERGWTCSRCSLTEPYDLGELVWDLRYAAQRHPKPLEKPQRRRDAE